MLRVGLAAVAVLLAASGCGAPSDAAQAVDACHLAVRERLVSAQSSTFPERDEHTVTDDGDGRWTVSSYVRASTPFDGVERIDWTCTVRMAGDTWTVEEVGRGTGS